MIQLLGGGHRCTRSKYWRWPLSFFVISGTLPGRTYPTPTGGFVHIPEISPGGQQDVLQLHEQERDAVDEADQVGASAVERPLDPQLAHREEVVVLGVVEVEDAQATRLHAAARVAIRDLHAVAQEIILLLVGLQCGLGRAHLDDGANGVVDGFARQARIERIECLVEVAREHHLFFTGAAQRPVRPEGLCVAGVDRVPAESFLEVVGGGLLDERVFAIETRRCLRWRRCGGGGCGWGVRRIRRRSGC